MCVRILQSDNEDFLWVYSLHPRLSWSGTDVWSKTKFLHSLCRWKLHLLCQKGKRKKITVCVNYLTRSSMTHFLCEVTASVSSQLTEGRTRARGKCRTHRQHSASSGRTYVGTHWRIKIDPRSNTRWTKVLGTGGGRPGCRWNQLSGCWVATSSRLLIKRHGCHGD